MPWALALAGITAKRQNLPGFALAMRAFGRHLTALGRGAVENDERVGAGSTDMGDISHALPAIHPTFAIARRGELAGRAIRGRAITLRRSEHRANREMHLERREHRLHRRA